MKYKFLLLLVISHICFSQFEELSNEQLFESSVIELDESEIFDDIEHYGMYPISLTKANSILISRLPLIDRDLAIRIVDLIQLQGIKDYKVLFDSLDLSDIQRYILKTCTYLYPTDTRYPSMNWRFRSNYQIENVKGFEKNNFLGNKFDYYSRFDANYDVLKGGVLLNKDAGEPDNFDFISGYLNSEVSGFNILLGDYSIEFGLGNMLWRNFGLRKGAEVINPARYKGKGILPYRSSIESNFFRGIAITKYIVINNDSEIKFDAFVSRQFRHSTIDSVNNIVTSIKNDGLFRTNTEISKKNDLREDIIGGIFNYRINRFQFSIAGFHFNYPLELATQSSYVYKGKGGSNLSFFMSYSDDEHLLMTEITQDVGIQIASKLHYIFKANFFDMTVAMRYFPESYRAQFGYIFGENSSPTNEFGIYTGLTLKKIPNSKISIYADFYKTLGRTYYIPAIVSGTDLLGDFVYNFGRDFIGNLRFRYEIKNDFISDGTPKLLTKSDRISLRCELRANTTDKGFCRMRVEVCRKFYYAVKPSEMGVLIFGEYKTQIFENFNIGSRLSYYNTDSYNSAIWQYEYTMPGYALTYPLYGQGIRLYMYGDYKISQYIRIWVKYTQLLKNNQKVISSGYNEIEGFKSNRLTAQLDFYL